MIEIVNKLLLLHLVGCLHYCINDARPRKYPKGTTIDAEDAQRKARNSSSRVRMILVLFGEIFVHSQQILVKSQMQIRALVLSF